MAIFRFRLQSYLKVKEKLEDTKKQEYGLALTALERERHRLSALFEARERCVLDLKAARLDRVDVAAVRANDIYLKALKLRIQRQKAELEKAEERAESKRLELVEATKEHQKLQKLKENDYENYLHGEKLAEQKSVDELISYKYGKR